MTVTLSEWRLKLSVFTDSFKWQCSGFSASVRQHHWRIFFIGKLRKHRSVPQVIRWYPDDSLISVICGIFTPRFLHKRTRKLTWSWCEGSDQRFLSPVSFLFVSSSCYFSPLRIWFKSWQKSTSFKTKVFFFHNAVRNNIFGAYKKLAFTLDFCH